ncbi:MAG: S8 family serine peptidase [Gemmatimonadaceae bacterium]
MGVVGMVALGACSTDRPTAPEARRLVPEAPSAAFNMGTPTETYLVRSTNGGGVSATSASIAALGARVVRDIAPLGVSYVQGLSEAGAAQLAASPGVTVFRDRLVQMIPPSPGASATFLSAASGARATGTDQSSAQFFAQYQWSLKVTRANLTWTPSNGGAGETVCVLDTGVDPGHLDLNGRVDPTKAFSVILTPRFASDAVVEDYNFHGTFVSAQITSNGIGMASVAPNANLCAIKVLSQDGAGSFGDVLYGMYVASLMGADVINMSLGGYADVNLDGPFLDLMQEIIDGARKRGVLIVAAAGNDGVNLDDIFSVFGVLHVPSMMKDVVSVGATGPINQLNFDVLAGYSNYGGLFALDLVAPGGTGGRPGGVTADYIISACSRFAFGGACASGVRYLFGNGTSFASPIVAGAGAVVESNVGSMPTGQLETCLRGTAKWLYPGNVYGKGRLDVRSASLCSGK